MTPHFAVRATAHFSRLIRKLSKLHPDLEPAYARALDILEADPSNHTRAHPIKKLHGVQARHGQYRLRLGRWRFRYDISGSIVDLYRCSLRREDTYR
ncbi:MAG TPA: hypothetical protein VGB99_12560 [Acidobacteriota bacterium]